MKNIKSNVLSTKVENLSRELDAHSQEIASLTDSIDAIALTLESLNSTMGMIVAGMNRRRQTDIMYHVPSAD